MPSSSFRISDELKVQLEHASARLNKGKNWIINQALKEYLERHSFEAMRAEARRQSILASKTPFEGEEDWEKAGLETWDE